MNSNKLPLYPSLTAASYISSIFKSFPLFPFNDSNHSASVPSNPFLTAISYALKPSFPPTTKQLVKEKLRVIKIKNI